MKNKFLKTVALAVALISANTVADDYYDNQRFRSVGTVAELLGMSFYDDVPVNFTGTVGKQLGYEHYEFSDGTGTVVVEIEAEDFWGKPVNPGTKVNLFGEADREGAGIVVDVENIRVING